MDHRTCQLHRRPSPRVAGAMLRPAVQQAEKKRGRAAAGGAGADVAWENFELGPKYAGTWVEGHVVAA